ncbi:ETC complex I subunit [Rhizobium sp. SRDI969]|uniref:ETC complex I subunit n=1 Tax=Rhizobium sp. SRDI969 TaxID=3138252 RepID=UPI0021A94084|nr:ETC complex I subunit [Rhizobium leguminosarum]UWM84092.1 ETC complex I subunit [Rhizobium leguminosarum bv. viciae]
MMDVNRETHNRETKKPHTAVSASRPANDNQRKPLSFGRSVFPEDAVARIFKPSRSAMTSGTRRTKDWRLVFQRRSAPFIEPLMGYTGSTDTLTQVELEFPTLESAIRYAERQGLTYRVQRQASSAAASTKQRTRQQTRRPSRAFSDAALQRLGPAACQKICGQAQGPALQTHVYEPATWPSPADVVRDRTLQALLDLERNVERRDLQPTINRDAA